MTATSDSDDVVSKPAEETAGDAGGHNGSPLNALGLTKNRLDQARGTVADAYATGRERASDAYAAAREKARSARQSASTGLETNPMTALLGGLAAGAVIGALIPRTRREAKALGTVGEKLQGAAREAVGAAKEAGRGKMTELGLSQDHARSAFKSVVDGLIAAATSAGTAALEKARSKQSDTEKP